MSFSDLTQTRSSIETISTNATFSSFIKETIDRIHALGLFYSVGVKLRQAQSIVTPSCIVLPEKIDIVEAHMSNRRYQLDYNVGIGIAVRNPNDCALMQQILVYEQRIRRAFMCGDDGAHTLLFDSIPEHYNTKVIPTAIEPIDELTNDIFCFSCGVGLVYSTWENIVTT
jgi:hypothetical protein